MWLCVAFLPSERGSSACAAGNRFVVGKGGASVPHVRASKREIVHGALARGGDSQWMARGARGAAYPRCAAKFHVSSATGPGKPGVHNRALGAITEIASSAQVAALFVQQATKHIINTATA